MNTNGKKRQANVGLNLLRMFMCFEVVLCHFWRDDTYSSLLKPFMTIRTYAVPVFMCMSFYLTKKVILSKNVGDIKKRLWRIVWPQVKLVGLSYIGAHTRLRKFFQIWS